MEYDLNGNILYLKRHSPSFYGNSYEIIDDLVYEYSENQLSMVYDDSGNPSGYEGGGNQIEYDGNGNMLQMKDKLIEEITYNHLNLPNRFAIDDKRKNMNYLYRSDGSKLKKNFMVTGNNGEIYGSSMEYLDGFHYSTSSGDELWAMFQSSGGGAYESEACMAFLNENNYADVLKFVPTAEGFYDFENKHYLLNTF